VVCWNKLFLLRRPTRKNRADLSQEILAALWPPRSPFKIIRSSKPFVFGHALIRGVACGSILPKIAVSDLVIIKLIHKFVEDIQIASSIQSLVEENWTDSATTGDCTSRTFVVAGSCRQPQTYVKPEGAITVFEILMMSGVSLETC